MEAWKGPLEVDNKQYQPKRITKINYTLLSHIPYNDHQTIF